MKIWNVITPGHELLTWFETWKARLFHRFPKVGKDGFVWLNQLPYVVDDSQCIREYYYPRKYFGLVRREDRHYYWRENQPAPIIFDQIMTPGQIGITGETIRTYAASTHLKRLLEVETNWRLIAMICIIVGLMAGAIGYSLGIERLVKP